MIFWSEGWLAVPSAAAVSLSRGVELWGGAAAFQRGALGLGSALGTVRSHSPDRCAWPRARAKDDTRSPPWPAGPVLSSQADV